MMVFDRGDMGRIDGSMGIGAPCVNEPIVQVLRLVACGRTFAEGDGALVSPLTGDGSGDSGWAADIAGTYCGTAGALSRAINDFLNQEEVLDVRVLVESIAWPADDMLRSECFRFSSRGPAALGSSGSTASAKYS